MKTIIQEEIIEFICDNCKQPILDEIAAGISFGFKVPQLGGGVFHFCTIGCFINWVGGLVIEINKMREVDVEYEVDGEIVEG